MKTKIKSARLKAAVSIIKNAKENGGFIDSKEFLKTLNSIGEYSKERKKVKRILKLINKYL